MWMSDGSSPRRVRVGMRLVLKGGSIVSCTLLHVKCLNEGVAIPFYNESWKDGA